MKDAVHVWQIMKANDPERRTLIERPANDGEAEPSVSIVYDGKLKNVPPKTALERVRREEWDDLNNCVHILLEPYDTHDQRERMLSEIYDACERDPFVRDRIIKYLSASEFGREMMEGHIVADLLSGDF